MAAQCRSLVAGAMMSRPGFLAAGGAPPELMDHWLHAPDPYGKAVITAAVDGRRLGVQAYLPDAFLQAAGRARLLHRSERARA
jgi:hypothetical protein